MKPIPTIEELTAIAKSDARHVFPWYTDFQITASIAAPLFAAIAERDAEIERLRGLMSEAYDCAASIHGGYKLPLDCIFTVANIASLLDQRNGTTEPEPAKPETFEAKPDPHAHLREAEAQGRVIQVNWGSSEAPQWADCHPGIRFDFAPEFYRVKPWTLPPPPEPEVWVDLGPEDVPPGSVFQLFDRADSSELAVGFHSVVCVSLHHVILFNEYGNRITIEWPALKDWQINRSLSAGKWDPNAWEPCKKLKA